MLIELFILVVLVGGIVAAAYRWPDVERRLWPDQVMRRPGEQVPPTSVSEPTAQPSKPAEPAVPSARGMMKKRPVATEPEVDEAAPDPTPASEPATVEVTEQVTVEETTSEDGAHATKTTVSESVTVSEDSQPGGLVSGTPARPSQPAYYDATGGQQASSSELAGEVDRAYRERNYEAAEQAALQLLAQDPKNHKYMTRLGQIYQELGQLEDAKEAFEEAKKLDPKNFFVLNRLAEVERLLSDKGGRSKHKK